MSKVKILKLNYSGRTDIKEKIKNCCHLKSTGHNDLIFGKPLKSLKCTNM